MWVNNIVFSFVCVWHFLWHVLFPSVVILGKSSPAFSSTTSFSELQPVRWQASCVCTQHACLFWAFLGWTQMFLLLLSQHLFQTCSLSLLNNQILKASVTKYVSNRICRRATHRDDFKTGRHPSSFTWQLLPEYPLLGDEGLKERQCVSREGSTYFSSSPRTVSEIEACN